MTDQHEYTEPLRQKYPRTSHAMYSKSKTSGDRVITSCSMFYGQEVVVTEKMDGENFTLYRDGLHARSIDSKHHESHSWIKDFQHKIFHLIPEGWRICGENLYAKHSIHYDNLESYFYGFSVWNDKNIALGWDETLKIFKDLGITPVPELYRGAFDVIKIMNLSHKLDLTKQEGYVCRVAKEIPFYDFDKKVFKWVRAGHVQTSKHLSKQPVIPNRLKGVL
jgi:hypothetical protein